MQMFVMLADVEEKALSAALLGLCRQGSWAEVSSATSGTATASHDLSLRFFVNHPIEF
jgi:hypothetical protein